MKGERIRLITMMRSLIATYEEFVVGSPYTTETVLSPDDTFLIVACDGVSELQIVLNLILIFVKAMGCCERPRSC